MTSHDSLDLDALAAALAAIPRFAAVRRADLQPLRVKGIAHDHVRIRGTGLLLRVPRQSQFALSAEANLAYQTACFERARPGGATPRLHATLPPSASIPMGALVIDEIQGRAMQLPDDLASSAACLAAIHRLPVPEPAARPPLENHQDPVAGTLRFIERQVVHMPEARVPRGSAPAIMEDLAWAREFARGPLPPQPVTLTLTDSHPGNFLIERSGRAVFVDLEKMLYGSPAIDLAHHTLYTSTMWDVDCRAVLAPADVRKFHRRYLSLLPQKLAAAVRPWILPARRLTWLRTITWAMKWRVVSEGPTPEGEDWSPTLPEGSYRAHVAGRIADFLDPVTVARIRAEWTSPTPPILVE